MEADTATRYRSRILREMNANRENPFNSPPSSTGSHRAASPTLSSVFSDPEGESTRRLNEDIARVTAPRKLPVNWEAAHRKWPEFYSMPIKSDRAVFDHVANANANANANVNVNANANAPAQARHSRTQSKENLDPLDSEPAPLLAKYNLLDDTTDDAWNGSKRTRAEMQPRVDNESDLSSILSKSPVRGLGRGMGRGMGRGLGAHGANKNATAHGPRISSKTSSHHKSAPPGSLRHKDQMQDAISEALVRLRRASSSPKSKEPRSHDESSPNMSSAKSSMTAVPTSPSVAIASPGHDTTHGRSFFIPDVSHLGDFVTGTLRFTGSVRDGVPILVKHGKVHDQKVKPFAARHAEIDGVVIPEGEEKIFVSMDMIREEIVSLQDHHDKIQEYASGLQREVERLETQLGARKPFDGSLGMDQKKALEVEIASLQARLDQANQKVSSGAIENGTLAHERDRVLSRLQEACDDINKLTRKLFTKEKELETTSRQLESTGQTWQENQTLRRDLADLKQSRQGLELKNTSLRADNENLRKEVRHLREESESLRSDNRSLRADHQSLLAENRSLRTARKTRRNDHDDLQEDADDEEDDGLQHDLEVAREEIENLQQELRALSLEKSTLRQDNNSLVRHNEKYFSENKILRRENSGFERSIHDLHDEISKLKGELVFLKDQLDHDHGRPTDGRIGTTTSAEDEAEENMTSAFFVPDITMNSNEEGRLGNLGYKSATGMLGDATRTTKDTTTSTAKQDSAKLNDRKNKADDNKIVPASKTSGNVQKVAFSLPDKSTESSKASSTQANQGSKRKSGSSRPTITDVDIFGDHDDTTGVLSVDNTTQDQSVSMSLTFRSVKGPDEPQPTHKTGNTGKQQQRCRVAPARPTAAAREAIRPVGRDSCPALSNNARRVLDGLSGHKCQNCIVCSRITSHNGVASPFELAAGKKRVVIPRPVPVSERQVPGDDPTVRPSQAPGHALALVIKGLEDESQHLQLELIRLQAQYNGSDKSQGRKQRLGVAEAIKSILKQLEVKNDQIYSLYDVLEGQKAVGQAMNEEEIELTVLNIMGMGGVGGIAAARDVTSGSEQTVEEVVEA